jgi:hypothetical protein
MGHANEKWLRKYIYEFINLAHLKTLMCKLSMIIFIKEKASWFYLASPSLTSTQTQMNSI